MIFLALAVIAGWLIDRIWPTLALCALGYAVITTPVQMLLAQHNRAEFGESMDWSIGSIAIGVATGFALFLAISLGTFGIKKLATKK